MWFYRDDRRGGGGRGGHISHIHGGRRGVLVVVPLVIAPCGVLPPRVPLHRPLLGAHGAAPGGAAPGGVSCRCHGPAGARSDAHCGRRGLVGGTDGGGRGGGDAAAVRRGRGGGRDVVPVAADSPSCAPAVDPGGAQHGRRHRGARRRPSLRRGYSWARGSCSGGRGGGHGGGGAASHGGDGGVAREPPCALPVTSPCRPVGRQGGGGLHPQPRIRARLLPLAAGPRARHFGRRRRRARWRRRRRLPLAHRPCRHTTALVRVVLRAVRGVSVRPLPQAAVAGGR
mmetsp:Transcript_12295/g.29767  ORF Transcript_12295/g.29767 Transcript_12295/m.29767 type:complete len:284 (+) Transcript_12295:667-1518(+)